MAAAFRCERVALYAAIIKHKVIAIFSKKLVHLKLVTAEKGKGFFKGDGAGFKAIKETLTGIIHGKSPFLEGL